MISATLYSGKNHERAAFRQFQSLVSLIPTRLSNYANENHYDHRFRMQKLNLPSSWASCAGWKKSRESLLRRNVSCKIILNGRLHLAIADNQASANVMSLDFARREQIKVDWVAVPFILVDGSMCYSVGQATAKCALQSGLPPSQIYVFYIFLNPVEPLILGRKFLHENGLIKLSHTPSQLLSVGDEDSLSAPTRMSLSHLDSSRFQVKAVLKFGNKVEEVFLLPDRGSDIDVMSMAYARKIGIDIMPCRPSQDSIRLADGRIGRVVGSAYASLHFCSRARHLETIATHFAIIDNPPFEIVLGNSSIEGTRIFEDKSDFEWAYTIEDHAVLCMLRASQKRPTAEILTDEEKMMNAISFGMSNSTRQREYNHGRATLAEDERHEPPIPTEAELTRIPTLLRDEIISLREQKTQLENLQAQNERLQNEKQWLQNRNRQLQNKNERLQKPVEQEGAKRQKVAGQQPGQDHSPEENTSLQN